MPGRIREVLAVEVARPLGAIHFAARKSPWSRTPAHAAIQASGKAS